MKTIFSYNKNSFSFSQNQKKILFKLINFFKYYIPQGNWCYLDMLNLDNIEFTWCTEMALPLSDSIGAWFMIFPNKIFLQPGVENFGFYKMVKKLLPSIKDQQLIDFCKIHIIDPQQYMIERWNKNKYLDYRQPFRTPEKNRILLFLEFMFQQSTQNSSPLSTIFHELYHKWQFNNSFYVPYIMNFFVQLLFGYQLSTKLSFFIQGDVRKYIDRKELHDAIHEFNNIFNEYINIKSQIIKYQNKYNSLKNKLNLTQNEQLIIEIYERNIQQQKKFITQTNNMNKFAIQLYQFIEKQI